MNVYMMPGTAIPYLPNDEKKFKTTHDINANGDVHVLINRDENGSAKGKIFFDDGISEHQLDGNFYEYYTLQHSGKTIKRWNKNESPNEGKENTFKIDKLIILNAEDLKDTNFACAMLTSASQMTTLKATYDGPTKTLTISPITGAIAMSQLASIFYGNDAADPNVCNTQSQFYKFSSGSVPDLSSGSASAEIESLVGNHQPLKLEMSIREGGLINIKWNFLDKNLASKQFQVPDNIANSKLAALANAKLSDYITITTNDKG